MVYSSLKQLADQMNSYLESYYDSLEQMVEVNSIKLNSNSEIPNKIIVSLINIERETGLGNPTSYRAGTFGALVKGAEPWYFNLNFVMAAVFDEKKYVESLQKLSTAIEYLQMNSHFKVNKSTKITIEPVNPSLHELNNVWSVMGGHHYPAFFGKIRLIMFDGKQIKQHVSRISKPRKLIE